MNEALYDLSRGIETYTIIGVVLLVYVLGCTLAALYIVWYNKIGNRPDSSSAFLGEGSEQLLMTTINKKPC